MYTDYLLTLEVTRGLCRIIGELYRTYFEVVLIGKGFVLFFHGLFSFKTKLLIAYLSMKYISIYYVKKKKYMSISSKI